MSMFEPRTEPLEQCPECTVETVDINGIETCPECGWVPVQGAD